LNIFVLNIFYNTFEYVIKLKIIMESKREIRIIQKVARLILKPLIKVKPQTVPETGLFI
jgi:hypothetical protein